MADTTPQPENNPNDQHKAAQVDKWRRRRRWLLIAGIPVALASLLIIPRTLAWTGWSQGFVGHHGCHGFHTDHEEISEEQIREHMDQMLPYLFWRIDATDDQQRRLRSLLEQAVPDMVAIHNEAHALRQQFTQALVGEQVDHQELDQLQQELQSLTNRATDLIMQRIKAASEVLSAEQRAKIVEQIHSNH